ncbi:tRNA glutamyl-Q(34) synthetase GluQRS [Azorhizobium oxalatiphilum]|uniref:tRNA glutamyl-Q(34) synthetase GluQRS n=1 Tax=Azorhizobium oxalatiphilum TaxID=980631 RepID=A0A917CI00_9HYPH|nr:tRNA glutamyl-Q(34) synthetase GluQRS [Azorhizobium oxalatiphilum]GGF87425.1 tRNA glutamyl-Q(34) synthetase GluQRS [Azorhizobium oxalatiphilum]
MTLNSSSFTCRFAPSPNGPLHLGHAYSALVNHAAAEMASGRFLLRMEDIDTTRCRPEFETGIAQDLAWLGILPSEPPRRQSQHFDDYEAALQRLDALGLLYASFESRAEIARAVLAQEAGGGAWPRDPDGAPLYPFSRESVPDGVRHRRKLAGEPYVLRLDMERACDLAGQPLSWQEAPGTALATPQRVPADPARWGDVVLARKDVPASYHLAVVVDDQLQAITHVIRGRDLFAATEIHRLLQTLLGLPEPIYHHHALVLDADRRKLSKSTGAASLAALRAAGASPDEVKALIDRGLEQAQPTPST